MKKIVFGMFLFLTGIFCTTGLLMVAASKEWVDDDYGYSVLRNLSHMGLNPIAVAFIIIAVIGLILGLWGVFEKKD